jgi:hypothetical protein
MFGLMKAKICSQPAKLRQERRFAYCGTCKAMGSRYGHRSRLLLNHDTVFLAELLMAMTIASGPVVALEKALRSFNCFALPANPAAVPLPLRYAAAATLFISEEMLSDHQQDSKSKLSKWAARMLASSFHMAEADLADWGIPVADLRDLLATQVAREGQAMDANRNGRSGRLDVEKTLRQVAEPTARGTALVFEHGARLIGRSDLSQAMNSLGHAFGTLIYFLDAFEDEEKDAQRGDFNAFRTALGAKRQLSPADRFTMLEILELAGSNVEACLQRLPIPEEQKAFFLLRLGSNLSSRLGTDGAGSQACCSAAMVPLRHRARKALSRAKEVAEATLRSSSGLVKAGLAPPVILLALPLAFFFPFWVNQETRLSEAYGLLLNMMFAGQAAKALVRPFSFSALGPEEAGHLAKQVAHKAKKAGGGGCDGCDCCDSCECCDCCECCGSCDC